MVCNVAANLFIYAKFNQLPQLRAALRISRHKYATFCSANKISGKFWSLVTRNPELESVEWQMLHFVPLTKVLEYTDSNVTSVEQYFLKTEFQPELTIWRFLSHFLLRIWNDVQNKLNFQKKTNVVEFTNLCIALYPHNKSCLNTLYM